MTLVIKLVFAFGIATLVTANRDLSGFTKCPESDDGWVLGTSNTHCYLLTLEKLTWENSKDYCKSIGGSLASINNQGENDFIKRFHSLLPWYEWGYWIGLYDSQPGSSPIENGYVWSDGSPFGYFNWDRSQNLPDNYKGQETVAEMLQSGQWNDNNKNARKFAVCKKEKPTLLTACDPDSSNDGWFAGPTGSNDCYYPLNVDRPQNFAASDCRNVGGFLTSILSTEEDKFVTELSRKRLSSKPFWIGYAERTNLYWTDFSNNQFSKAGGCFVSDPSTSEWITKDCKSPNVGICKKKKTPRKYNLGPCDGDASSDWLQGPNPRHCYKRTNAVLSWDAAEAFCKSEGGHLASITNNGDNDFILSSFTTQFISSLWIGARYNDSINDFSWSDGTKFQQDSSWFSHRLPIFNEPNGRQNGEDCGKFLGVSNGAATGKWKDDDCSQTAFGVCKKQVEVYEGPAGFKPCDDDNKNDGWLLGPKKESCFYFVEQQLKRSEIEPLCVQKGGLLTSIIDRDENNFVASLKSGYPSASTNLLIGLNRQGFDSTWLDGSSSSYRNFAPDAAFSDPRNCTVINTANQNYWDFHMCRPGIQEAVSSGVCKKEIYHGPEGFEPCDEDNPNDGWLIGPKKNKCYYFVEQQLKRSEMEPLCVDKGGLLTSIIDRDENNFVASLKSGYSSASSKLLIGLNRRQFDITTDLAWIDGSPVNFKNFYPELGVTVVLDSRNCTVIDTANQNYWDVHLCFIGSQEAVSSGVCKKDAA